jgi:hypothetical protein
MPSRGDRSCKNRLMDTASLCQLVAVEIVGGRDALAVVNVGDSPRLRASGNFSSRPHHDVAADFLEGSP